MHYSKFTIALTLLQTGGTFALQDAGAAAGLAQRSDVIQVTRAEILDDKHDVARAFPTVDLSLAEGRQDGVDKRFFLSLITLLTADLGWAVATWNLGMGVLGQLAAGGAAILQNTGVIRGAINGVFAIWSRGFAVSSGFRRRSEYGDMPVFGVLTRPDTDSTHSKLRRGQDIASWTRLESHVSIDEKITLKQAAMNAHNGTEFLHIATLYSRGTATHTLHYRRAHSDDLGMENDGSYHHVRALSVTDHAENGKRAEVDDSGTVMDYLWKEGNQDLWTDTYYDTHTFDQTAAAAATTWMQNNGAEATCADVIIDFTEPNSAPYGGAEDSGVLAFGWHHAPFGFNGRAATWISECEY
ncbi:DNA-repair protein rad2 [Purpureocillium lavendulum]|uniref:DNA-repair protein rad2 n=1 Tax=Purpureocillium lavendulum TaxID=1247861 RepID=A0AB34FKN0_9HYPO|nr:DNA-repair protein rad2 [Purpureocillium lavendulum]